MRFFLVHPSNGWVRDSYFNTYDAAASLRYDSWEVVGEKVARKINSKAVDRATWCVGSREYAEYLGRNSK